jgi:tRNA(Arg) A34 adenosine deaminase TadA
VRAADVVFLRRTFALAQRARKRGDEPFGAIVVDHTGNILAEAANTNLTEHGPTGHAEINAVRAAARQLDADVLARCTIYASIEPCAMCCAAIYWSGIGRVVFGLRGHALLEMAEVNPGNDALSIPSREIFARGKRTVEVEALSRTWHGRYIPAAGCRSRSSAWPRRRLYSSGGSVDSHPPP